MLVGNQEEAQLIHDWYHAGSTRQDLPAGWSYLGEGSFRAAYLSPSGVVYKVQKNFGDYQTNRGEYDKWRQLYFGCKMPRYSRLPKLSYFETDADEEVGVVAIERLSKNYSYWGRVPGGNASWGQVINQISHVCKVGDLGGENLFLSDDGSTIIPTDLADPTDLVGLW